MCGSAAARYQPLLVGVPGSAVIRGSASVLRGYAGLMAVRIVLHENDVDSQVNVRFAGVPGVREDVSHVWLAPRGDGQWALGFVAERPEAMRGPDLQALLDRAWEAGFAVHDCDRENAVVRSADELSWSDGCHVLAHSMVFPSREAAEEWLRTHAETLFALADEESLREPDRDRL